MPDPIPLWERYVGILLDRLASHGHVTDVSTLCDRIERVLERIGGQAVADAADTEEIIQAEIVADLEAEAERTATPGHVKAARKTQTVVRNLLCRNCGNHVASNAHRAACDVPARKPNNAGTNGNGHTVATTTKKVVDGCPKCSGRLGHDGDGDTVCLTCGWRQVAGASVLAALARAEVESERRNRGVQGVRV